jgi:hypothetical protein
MANRSARTAASCSSDVSAGLVASLRISDRCCSSSSLIRHSNLSPDQSITIISSLLYRPGLIWFDTLPTVPLHTEVRIQKLIAEALAATSDSEVERILPDLRSALQEHIRLAKESLEAQVITLDRPLRSSSAA